MLNTIVISAALAIIAFAAGSHALLNKRDSKSAFGWVAFCLFLPFIGPLVYLVFGINRINERAQRKFHKEEDEELKSPLSVAKIAEYHTLSTIGHRLTGRDLQSCNSIDILENGEELYPDMLAAIDQATDRIFLSTYIFANDETGDKFVAALNNAKARGVDVRVIIDGMGEFYSLPRIGNKLQTCELKIQRFNPISLLPPSLNINMRNHRKILTVDGRVAFTGGQNIGDRHLLTKPRNPKRTADLHFRLTGKIVDDLELAFVNDWNQCQANSSLDLPTSANRTNSDADVWSRLILDGPNQNIDKLNELLLGLFSAAKSKIWIMTPYFLPGMDLIGALVGARLRGVDIKIFLPERSNIHLAHWATHHTLRYFLEKDIEIYFQPNPFIHTKAILIDDCCSVIGSANLDPRSLRLNFELVVEVFSKEFAARLQQYFLVKLQSAIAVNGSRLKTRSLAKRIRDGLAWLFTPYL